MQPVHRRMIDRVLTGSVIPHASTLSPRHGLLVSVRARRATELPRELILAGNHASCVLSVRHESVLHCQNNLVCHVCMYVLLAEMLETTLQVSKDDSWPMHHGLFTLPLALGAYLVHNSQELEGFSNCPHGGMFTSSVEQLHLSLKQIYPYGHIGFLCYKLHRYS
jgi:hypothetical protein